MDRTLLGILTALGAALLLVGLTFSRSVDAPADLRFNNQTEPKTLDPQLMTGQPEMRLADALFEGLARRDAKTMRPSPGVAESWDISPDGTRYTFHLRANARWTDGHPVTAHDFVYAWRRLLDPKIAAEYAYIIFPVKGAAAFNTFDAHAAALDTPIAKALSGFIAEHPSGADAREWQRFLSKHTVHDPLRSEKDPVLRELVARQTGTIAARELEWMRRELPAIAARLRKGAADARAHFGVDTGVFAVDDRTLVVELRAPTPYFLEIAAYYPAMPLPRWVVEKHRDDWFLPGHIVTNGPFTLKRWLVNDHIRFERNESYWGKDEVRSRTVDVLASDNDTTAMNLYLTRAIDWDPAMYPRELGSELRKRPDFILSQAMTVYFYRINTTRPPFDDRRVRKALNLAIDRKPIVDNVLGLGQIAATTLVPPGMPGYESPKSEIRFDPERARALLAEAGHPGGAGLQEIGILYNTNQGHKALAEVVADQLRKNLGIRANAYNQEWQSVQETMRSLDYDLARFGWVGDYADPNTFLDMFVTNGGNNQTGFSSDLYDRLLAAAGNISTVLEDPELVAGLKHPDAIRGLIESARRAPPDEKLAALAKLRLRILNEAESILVNDELPIIPVYFYVNVNFVSPKLRGFYSTLKFEDGTTAPNLQDTHPLRDLWVDRGESR
jgi:oligopeptide transport system substrate-binding protein